MKNKSPISPSGSNAFQKLSGFQKWCTLITILVLTTTVLPLAMVLAIGMLPTFTILLTDPKNSSKLIIIGCFNLAGVFGYILDTISNFSAAYALTVIGNIFNLIIMLSSAALGLIIYSELPNLFLFFSHISTQRKLESINRRLDRLTEDWGKEILNNRAVPKED